MNFKKSNNDTSRSSETELQEVQNVNLQKYSKQTSGGSEIEPTEVQKLVPNYTNYNQTNPNHTEESYIYPINPSEAMETEDNTIDVMDDAQAYIELIKENISYEHHMKYDKYGQRELYDELFEVICEVVCVKRQTIRVSGEEYPYELVKSRFLKLNSSHLEYVIGCMKEATTKITNIKAYMVTALYNAPITMNHFINRKCSMICMEEAGMKKVLFRIIIPMMILAVWMIMCYPVCVKADGFDYFRYWIMVGCPYGIRKMSMFLVPKNFGIAGSIGILALDCIIGGLIGGMIIIIRIINTVMEIIKLISGTFGHNVQKCE